MKFTISLMIAAALGIGALLGTACWVSAPGVFLAVGFLVFASGGGIAVWLGLSSGRRKFGTAALATLSVVGAVALLWPARSITPRPPRGMQRVALSDGTSLAYLSLSIRPPIHRTPVIFLHGGPAVADMEGDSRYLRRLADSGFEVYLYDQLGSGYSSRLEDPDSYTVARAVADLGEFQRAIGAPRVDLIGYSWGGYLAAAYLAAHPDAVDKVVFVSPGRMPGGRSNLLDLLSRLDAAHLWGVLSEALEPRAFLDWVLVQFNARAAHAYAGDMEMDARLRHIVASLAPALYCHAPSSTSGGHPGYFANAMLLRPRAWRGIDPHTALRRLATPALVIKGSCDYLSWSGAIDYRDTLPHAQMVYVPGAGHRVYAERPALFTRLVKDFLEGQPLPLPLVTGSRVPASYRGPS